MLYETKTFSMVMKIIIECIQANRPFAQIEFPKPLQYHKNIIKTYERIMKRVSSCFVVTKLNDYRYEVKLFI